MKKIYWLLALTAIAGFAMGCGDDSTPTDSGTAMDSSTSTDSGTDGGTDSGMVTANCPSGDNIPDETGLMGACCYRTTNLDRHDDPQFRVAALSISQPGTLASPIVKSAVNLAIDEERFNWLFSVTGAAADGDITLKTGFGSRNADATFSFANGDAPAPGDVNRWDPQTIMGTLAGEVISTPALTGAFTVPILDADGTSVVLELPLQGFEVVSMTMSEDRSCVGTRGGRSYSTTEADLQTFITIADAQAGMVDLPPINTSLCNFIRGATSATGDCMDEDPATWMFGPDARCEAGACTEGCTAGPDLTDAATCNAWKLLGGFAAHGVTIN
jgi:hypothetical protein